MKTMSRYKYVFQLEIILFFTIISIISSCFSNNNNRVTSTVDLKVENLIEQMTLEEKAGQMTQIGIPVILEQEGYWDAADTLIIDTNKLKKALTEDFIGSFVGKGYYPPSRNEYYNLIKQIQDYATENTRLGIPIVYATDAVHGAHYTESSTIFPHQIAMAATWNPDLVEEMAKITAYELRASNSPWNFAPVIDVSWQAQWGRNYETFGEDPYLTSVMGAAFIKGAQGFKNIDSVHTATCAKHLIGYGSSQYGMDRKNAIIPERFLRQYYLPPFQKAVKEGVKSIMVSSGLVNSIPCHINKNLITKILKEELKFDGVVISDWGDMQFLSEFHKTAENHKEAVKKMVNAGIDICMVPYDASFAKHLIDLVNEGEVSIDRVNDAVRRILKFKHELGLFEHPNTHYDNYEDFGSNKYISVSSEAAKEAITLLKNNDNTLPLSEHKKVLITGVSANSINYLNGPWTRTWSGEETTYNDKNKLSIYGAIKSHIDSSNVNFVKGTNYDTDININQVVKEAKHSDYVIVCLGEKLATERPSDIKSLEYPKVQLDLVKALSKTNKPIILILLEGRTRLISSIEPLVDAIIMGYYPGQEAAKPITDIIYGKINPSGKLPISYQKFGSTPMPYLHTVSDRSDNFGTYTDYDPLWPFGFGLSYTTYNYQSISCSSDTLKGIDSLSVKIRVCNSGSRKGKEVVQLYIRDEYASIDPDFEKLIAFKKIELNENECKDVVFSIDKSDLAFVNSENEWIVEDGLFTLRSGDRNKQLISCKINYQN